MRPVVEVLRTATTVALLGAAQLITGASGLLAIGYVPIVATATGRSLRRLGIVVGMSIAMHMLVEAYARADSGSPLDLSLRGLAFGLFLVVGATVMRMQLLRVDGMRQRLRESLRADRRRERQIGAVERIGRILANSGPTDRALGNVVSHLSEELGFRYVAIYIGDRQLVRLGAQRGYADLVDRFDGTRGVVGRVMRTGRSAFVPDVTLDPDYWQLNRAVRSEICVPLVADGEFLGFLNVESTTRTLEASDLRLVVAIGDRLSAALVIGRERERLFERAELFRHLHAFGEAVSATLEPAELHAAIVRGAVAVVAADDASLAIVDRASGEMAIAAALHDPAPAGLLVSGQGPSGRALVDGTIVVAEDADGGTAAVPLLRHGDPIGVLTLRRVGPRGFGAVDRDALSLLAEQASLAVANAFLHADVADMAVRDPLTGLFNRRYLDPALQQLFAQRSRLDAADRVPLAAIMFDLDRFSDLNNRYGHQAGDEVLRQFGAVLRTRMRTTDLVARYGGEEFAAVLFRADLADATRIADEVRRALAEVRIETPDGVITATVSAGCSSVGTEPATADQLVRAADVALSMAKRAGRDRVVATSGT